MSRDPSWQPPELDPPALDRVQHLLDQFESDWVRTDEEPELNQYLEALDNRPQRTYLLVQLIRASNFQRAERGWTLVNADQYAEQFPGDIEAIRFACRSLGSKAGPPEVEDELSGQGESQVQRDAKGQGDVDCVGGGEIELEAIGRYRIQRVLGRGSFGIVYLAHDPQLNRLVAIKVPIHRAGRSPETALAFLAEARAAAGLNHPGIVPVYDIGQLDDGRCFVVSEYIEGQDLAVSLRHQRPSVRRATELVAEVAETLHAAHLNGIFHRDVKPGNILLDRQGCPRLVDFGLALRVEDLACQPSTAGTPDYMSPEQAAGQSRLLDGRADIFSLGIVLYELLTGIRPFTGGNLSETLQRIQKLPARPLRQIDDRLSAELERICLKALEKRPEDRFATAQDLATALRASLSPLEVPPSAGSSAPSGSSSPSGAHALTRPGVGQAPAPADIACVLEHYHQGLLASWDSEGRPACYIEPSYSVLVDGQPEDLSRLAIRQREPAPDPGGSAYRATAPSFGSPLASPSRHDPYRPLSGETADEQLTCLLSGTRRVCLTGDAGTGKSVFTSRLAALLASPGSQAQLLGPGPWLVARWEQRVRSWPRRFDTETLTGELGAALRDSCRQVAPDPSAPDPSASRQAAETLAASLLEQGRVVLILDALDQVGEEATLDSLKESLHSGPAARCLVVLTSRSHAVNQRSDLFEVTGPWRFGRVDGFDPSRQDAYLREACGSTRLEALLPSRSAVGPLLECPLVLSLIGRLARAGELARFETQSDLFLQLDRFLVTRAAQKLGWRVDDMRRARWREILSATACEMMCRRIYDYSVRGDEAVLALRRGASRRCAKSIEPGEWREVERISDFSEHSLLEDASDRLLSFKHRSMMEFYCGLHLANNSQLQWVADRPRGESPPAVHCGDAEVARRVHSPDWYWAVRFAIEMDPRVWQADPHILLATLSSLFAPLPATLPASAVPGTSRGASEDRARAGSTSSIGDQTRHEETWLRPTELMYRAWPLLEPDARGVAPLPGGPELLRRFERQFEQFVQAGDPAAQCLQRGFRRCPPRPNLLAGLGGLFRRTERMSDEQTSFLMGADDFPRDAPPHEVRLAPFEVQDIPVTRWQYALFDPQHARRYVEILDTYAPRADCPVIMVTWYDAWVYSRWVGARLPTEAEWELACRAGSTTRYWWGDEFDASRCNAGGEAGGTLPPDRLRQNAWGLRDMLGNVGQWCQDWFGKDYYPELAAHPIATNPEGPREGTARIVRGGSWADLPLACRCAHREHDVPDRRSYAVGFRLVRDRSS